MMIGHQSQDVLDEKKDENEVPSVRVILFVRNGHTGEPMLPLEFKASTVQELKAIAVGLLKPTNIKSTTLSEEDIWIFQANKQFVNNISLLSATAGGGGQNLEADSAYIALEVFSVCPRNMFRTIKPEELSPATITHPDYVGSENENAAFSPLMCAALKLHERSLPWYGHFDEKEGTIQIFGVSLSCEDGPTPFDFSDKEFNDINPYRPVEENELVGATKMSSADFQKLLQMAGSSSIQEGYGVTVTTLTHDDDAGEFLPKKSRITYKKMGKREKADRQAAGKSCERNSYFMYLLEEGVNLRQHGMAIVYDGCGERHCSLVHLNDVFASQVGWYYWNSKYSARGLHVWLPKERQSTDVISMDERKHIMAPGAELQPEVFGAVINGNRVKAFPKVSSLFAFAGFQMRASAVPIPLEEFENDDQRTMCMAALILHTINNGGENIQKAVFELEAAKYCWEKIPKSSQLALQYAMKEAANNSCSKLTKVVLDQMGVVFDGEDDEDAADEDDGEECERVLNGAVRLFDLTFADKSVVAMSSPNNQGVLGASDVSPSQSSTSSDGATTASKSSASTLFATPPRDGKCSLASPPPNDKSSLAAPLEQLELGRNTADISGSPSR